MIITTGLEPNETTMAHAIELAESFAKQVVPRRDASIQQLRRQHQDDAVLVVSAKGARLEIPDQPAFFFHPNNSAFRIKRLERGDTDTMLSVCQIQPGDDVLDATLGLGADSIVFAYAIGENGRVAGIESQTIIAKLVEDGMKRWRNGSDALESAMRRVEVITGHHLDVMSSMKDKSFDVVYFDPMFETTVDASAGIGGVRAFANAETLSAEAVQEALRVARRRVVLKEGSEGKLHERFGFTPYRKRERQAVYSFREIGGGE
ncbi:UNVERIFIED_CONTAM: 16S rRNA (guanine1516-N2)-methyltransferase [Brevibacillus sp. OAP136]